MLELLKQDLTTKGAFSGALPDIVRQTVESINNPQIPYRFKLTIAASELVLFASHFRRNIEHWNGSMIPINSLSFVISGSGSGKDSAVNSVRKCFKEGYIIIEDKRKAVATQNAIRSAQLAGKPDPDEWNTYKEFYEKPEDLFASVDSTQKGLMKHFNTLEESGIGGGFLYSGEIGSELVSGGIIPLLQFISEVYDEGNKEVKLIGNKEEQGKAIKNFPVTALFVGSQNNILYDESIKRIFKREFSTKLARRSFFNFSPETILSTVYPTVAAMLLAETAAEDASLLARKKVSTLIKEVAAEATKGAGQPLKVSAEVRELFITYKRYNEELSNTLSPQYQISKLVRSHMQWKALKFSGAIAIFNKHNSILLDDYIAAITYCEMLDEDMQNFETELMKEPYEVFVDYMKSMVQDNKSFIGLHQLRKLAYIPTSGTPTTKMKELVHLATSYDKSGIYTICDDGICYEAIQKTDIIGVSYLTVTGTKEERQSQCAVGYEFSETLFKDLDDVLRYDLAYAPFQFKDGKRSKENIIGGCKWVCLDIDDSSITDEECHFILQDINHHIARTSDSNNPFKFRILLELDAMVDIPDIQWRPFIKSISESLSLKSDLLPKSQIYFAYAGRTVLSVTDQLPISVKEHLLVAASVEPRKEQPKLTTSQAKALLSDELETFSYAYNAQVGERYRSLVRVVYHAHDLGANVEYTSDLVEAINQYWDEPASANAIRNIHIMIKRIF